MRVPVAREFLECVEKNVIKQRPPWRVDVSTFDMERDSVIIMSDHSLFPGGNCCHSKCFYIV
jgi:inositol-pentakisphosphate 2-kinase